MAKKPIVCFSLFMLLLGHTTLFAQDRYNLKMGKITPADFDLSAQKIDTGAGAVVLADIGHSEFTNTGRYPLNLEFHRFRRVKILQHSGLDAAVVQVHLYSNGGTLEEMQDLKAVTYNLENGKVVETPLDNNSVFTDKITRNLEAKKFTFPAVKVGSIIEYSFTLTSGYLHNIQPWEFQGNFPCLRSEYDAEIPDFFKFVVLSQGYLPIKETVTTKEVRFRGVSQTSRSSMPQPLNGTVSDHHWGMTNIPALKEEKFTTTLKNHIAKIEFQFSRNNFPDGFQTESKLSTWSGLSEQLLKADFFGADLDSRNGWMDDELKYITRPAMAPLEKAKNIYAFMRDSFTCKYAGWILPDNPLKTVFKTRTGNNAAINLLLVAMLKHENIIADPLMLSTRRNGFTNSAYPVLAGFNYIICVARIDSAMYFLDANRPWTGFNHLPEDCYNGHSRIINKESPAPVYLDADSVRENKITTVFISNDEKAGLTGGVQIVPGYFESSNIREKVHKDGEKGFFKDLQALCTGGILISNTSIDSLKILEDPVKISYDFTMPFDGTSDVVYFNPLIAGNAFEENPFKSAERVYPVEMPSAFDKIYVLNMEIPKGYTVEELPQSAKILYNGDQGFFEYIIVKDESTIQLRSRVKLNKANFNPEEYNVLRDFYALIVKKESEQIVFKKKK